MGQYVHILKIGRIRWYIYSLAGTKAQILRKKQNFVIYDYLLGAQSIYDKSYAQLVLLLNQTHLNISYKGRPYRWLGKRPIVVELPKSNRSSHGGGEGKTSGGRLLVVLGEF
jgi:hypothetical protein